MVSICVFCGSADALHPDYLSAARQTGRVLAERGLRLIYGGGKTGLMGAVADGVIESGGEVIGVIIPSMNTKTLAHIGIARMEVVPDMHARKARMHELADGYIALPGGFGTFDELFETLTWGQIGVHEKPVGLLNVRNYFDLLMAMILHAEKEGFVFAEHRKMICLADSPQELLGCMGRHEHPREAVKRWMRQDK